MCILTSRVTSNVCVCVCVCEGEIGVCFVLLPTEVVACFVIMKSFDGCLEMKSSLFRIYTEQEKIVDFVRGDFFILVEAQYRQFGVKMCKTSFNFNRFFFIIIRTVLRVCM